MPEIYCEAKTKLLLSPCFCFLSKNVDETLDHTMLHSCFEVFFLGGIYFKELQISLTLPDEGSDFVLMYVMLQGNVAKSVACGRASHEVFGSSRISLSLSLCVCLFLPWWKSCLLSVVPILVFVNKIHFLYKKGSCIFNCRFS